MDKRYDRVVLGWFKFLLRASTEQLKHISVDINRQTGALQEAWQMLLALADD